MEEHVAEIVAAYLVKNAVAVADLPLLICSVYAALAGLGMPPAPVETPTPAVPVHRSISSDKITCLECGWSGQTLRRHLSAAHSLAPDAYRLRWKLPSDYPLVTPDYGARRSELARSMGFGQRGRGARRIST